MALSTSNNYINTLVSVGNDAQGHLYEVVFDGGVLADMATDLSVRCGGFTPPAIKQEAYTVKYITAYIDRPKAKVDVTRTFSLTFRMDDNWALYKALCEQAKVTFDPSTSFAAADVSGLMAEGRLFNVKVNVIRDIEDNNSSAVRRMFNFTGCWIEELKQSGFQAGSSEPIKADVKIHFLKMEDWQSGLKGDSYHSDAMLPSKKDQD